MDVGCSYQNEQLKVYPSAQGVQLAHPAECPCRFLTGADIANIPSSSMNQGVKVAVSILLQSSDDHILLTRRAEHMRTFPCVWVPPGGHVEPGEKLQQAFLRELKEETGLAFSESNIAISTLGLWESVFPPQLSMGLPLRHHIVVYFLAKAQEDHSTLQARLRLDANEVNASTWLDEATATEVARSDDFGQCRRVPQRYFSATVLENSKQVQKNLPLSNLMASLPRTEDGEEHKERLSGGAKFAIRQWLKSRYPLALGSLQRGDSLETVFQALTKVSHQPVKAPFWGQ